MDKWIIANFKMYKTVDEAISYANEFKNLVSESSEKIVVCPSFVGIYDMAKILDKTNIMVGAQNCAAEQEGAYTGEVSAQMIQSVGAKVVILGHSERRRYYNETDEIINKKVIQALDQDLIPVVCLADEGEGSLEETIRKQLEVILKGVYSTNIVLAFEPVWAIGTGKTMATEDIEPALALIKEEAKKIIGYMPEVLYGGSVKASNAKEILALNSVNGLLVGGASKDPVEFSKICLTDNV